MDPNPRSSRQAFSWANYSRLNIDHRPDDFGGPERTRRWNASDRLEVARRLAQPSPSATNQFVTRNAPLVAVLEVGILGETSDNTSWVGGSASFIWSIPVRVRDTGSDNSSMMSSTRPSGDLDYCKFHPSNSMPHRRRDNNLHLRCASWCSVFRLLGPQSLHPPREESRVWASQCQINMSAQN
jgi:hypothetical protein